MLHEKHGAKLTEQRYVSRPGSQQGGDDRGDVSGHIAKSFMRSFSLKTSMQDTLEVIILLQGWGGGAAKHLAVCDTAPGGVIRSDGLC